MNRQTANRELVKILSAWIEAYPDLRFSQILGNMEFVKQQAIPSHYHGANQWLDEYHLEPQELLKRVKASIGFNNT